MVTVVGARAILKTSSHLCLVIKAACQLEPQQGPLAGASARGLCVAWASSHHGGWIPRMGIPTELDRARSLSQTQSVKSHNILLTQSQACQDSRGENRDPLLKGVSVGITLQEEPVGWDVWWQPSLKNTTCHLQ